MKIAGFVSGLAIAFVASTGLMTPSTVHAATTYSDSCTPLGGGYSSCQTKRCDTESGVCTVVASWIQYIPEAHTDE